MARTSTESFISNPRLFLYLHRMAEYTINLMYQSRGTGFAMLTLMPQRVMQSLRLYLMLHALQDSLKDSFSLSLMNQDALQVTPIQLEDQC